MSSRPAKSSAAAAPAVKPAEPWLPDWKWHLKTLAGIYVFLLIVYVGMNFFLSRLPAPYGLRDIPKEMTPWLKK